MRLRTKLAIVGGLAAAVGAVAAPAVVNQATGDRAADEDSGLRACRMYQEHSADETTEDQYYQALVDLSHSRYRDLSDPGTRALAVYDEVRQSTDGGPAVTVALQAAMDIIVGCANHGYTQKF